MSTGLLVINFLMLYLYNLLLHDMKHHMNELKLLANRHNVADIQEYIDHMEEYIRNPNEIVASGNMEIDSVLNYMLQKSREEPETVIVKVMLPEKIKHTFDVNVALKLLPAAQVRTLEKPNFSGITMQERLKDLVILLFVLITPANPPPPLKIFPKY